MAQDLYESKYSLNATLWPNHCLKIKIKLKSKASCSFTETSITYFTCIFYLSIPLSDLLLGPKRVRRLKAQGILKKVK